METISIGATWTSAPQITLAVPTGADEPDAPRFFQRRRWWAHSWQRTQATTAADVSEGIGDGSFL